MRRNIRYRPSRASCIFTGIVGSIFTCIGLFVVMPIFGPFGALWTLIALGGTIHSFAMAAGKISAGSWSIEDEDRDGERAGRSVQDRLTELQGLYDRGLISREEYEEKRREIMKEL